jgi:hypothetical protein
MIPIKTLAVIPSAAAAVLCSPMTERHERAKGDEFLTQENLQDNHCSQKNQVVPCCDKNMLLGCANIPVLSGGMWILAVHLLGRN